MSVNPKVNLPNNFAAIQGDSLESAFNKYNNHSHSQARPTSFLSERVRVGDQISLRNPEGEEVFRANFSTLPVTVTAVTEEYIEVSQVANATVSSATLTVGTAPNLIRYVRTVLGDNRIYRSSVPSGFVTAEDLNNLTKIVLRGTVEIPFYSTANAVNFFDSNQQAFSQANTINANFEELEQPEPTSPVIGPTYTFFRGSSYRIILSEYTRLEGFYIVTQPTGTNLPAATFDSGVTYITAGGLITEVQFTVPYDAPDLLYYQSSAGSTYGQIRVEFPTIEQSRDYFSEIQSIVGSSLTEPLPILNPPVILSSPSRYRITKAFFLPVWNEDFRSGVTLVRFAKQTEETTGFITPFIYLDRVGRVSYTFNDHPFLEEGEGLNLSIFTRTQLAALHYQVELVQVL